MTLLIEWFWTNVVKFAHVVKCNSNFIIKSRSINFSLLPNELLRALSMVNLPHWNRFSSQSRCLWIDFIHHPSISCYTLKKWLILTFIQILQLNFSVSVGLASRTINNNNHNKSVKVKRASFDPSKREFAAHNANNRLMWVGMCVSLWVLALAEALKIITHY